VILETLRFYRLQATGYRTTVLVVSQDRSNREDIYLAFRQENKLVQKKLVVCSTMVKNVNDDQIVSHYASNPYIKTVELRMYVTIVTNAPTQKAILYGNANAKKNAASGVRPERSRKVESVKPYEVSLAGNKRTREGNRGKVVSCLLLLLVLSHSDRSQSQVQPKEQMELGLTIYSATRWSTESTRRQEGRGTFWQTLVVRVLRGGWSRIRSSDSPQNRLRTTELGAVQEQARGL
jgi:hypothetical protein